jgi:copper transport protein
VVMNLVVGWPLFLGLLLSTGAVTARFLILPFVPGANGSADPTLRTLTLQFGRVGATLAGIGMVAVFVRQFLEFRDPFGTFGQELSVLLSTPWSQTWAIGFAAVGLLLTAFLVAARWPRAGWACAAIFVLWADTFPAMSGHAAGVEQNRWLAIGADTLHVAAAGVWIGGLAVMLWLEKNRSSLVTPPETSLLPRLIPSFSRVAMVSVAVLVASGAFASFRELAHVSELWTSPYGRLLSTKLGLVAVVLGLGALNWRRLTAQLDTESGQTRMRRAATTEFILANVILLVTAMLVRTSTHGP